MPALGLWCGFTTADQTQASCTQPAPGSTVRSCPATLRHGRYRERFGAAPRVLGPHHGTRDAPCRPRTGVQPPLTGKPTAPLAQKEIGRGCCAHSTMHTAPCTRLPAPGRNTSERPATPARTEPLLGGWSRGLGSAAGSAPRHLSPSPAPTFPLPTSRGEPGMAAGQRKRAAPYLGLGEVELPR